MRYGMAIDLKRCMGCQTCMTSCRTANNLPTGNWWNRVITAGGGFFAKLLSDLQNEIL